MQHLWLIVALVPCSLVLAAPEKADFYVSPQGNDQWSGKLPAPNAQRTDGPFATLPRAGMAARKLAASPARQSTHAVGMGGMSEYRAGVILRGGTYTLDKPWVLGPQDSSVHWYAYPNEHPIISGGRRITGWKLGDKGLWTADLPQVKAGQWTFRQLWVNGQLRRRPRLPKEGWYALAGQANPAQWDTPENRCSFRYKPGDLRADWTNLADVEVVALQYWTEARLHIKSLDEKTQLVTFTGPSWRPLNWAKGYIVDNVREALDEPGEWYLDRKTGVLTYWPLPGEDMTKAEVVAPVLEQLVRLEGDAQHPIRKVKFSGLTFAYTSAPLPPAGHAYPQAEIGEPNKSSELGPAAAVYATHAYSCRFDNNEFVHLGQWAMELSHGCGYWGIGDNRMHDLGGGAIRIGSPQNPMTPADEVSGNTVFRNDIYDGNRLYMGAPAVWIGQSGHNDVACNKIHGPWEWAISVGWTWEYLPPNDARDNTIDFNHIYGLGNSELGTHAAIYCLGLSPGTVVRENLIHDIRGEGYGIILDQGCAGVLVENNLVHHADGGWCSNFHVIGNIIMNNIFALTRMAAMHRYGDAPPGGYTLSNTNFVVRNIFYFKEGRLELRDDWLDFNTVQDCNLYWDASGRPLQFLKYSFEEWQGKGLDRSSLIADPGFADPEHGDFSLAEDSPAFKLGFRPLDLGGVPR